jgi:hypothetical protein
MPTLAGKEFDEALYHIGIICERLPFTRPDPIKPEGYADHLSGNWDEVPAWTIRRINFLESQIEWNDNQRCPKGEESCPDVPPDPESPDGYSCRIVKHCYPYLCKGSCGHNEIWVSNKAKKVLIDQELI